MALLHCLLASLITDLTVSSYSFATRAYGGATDIPGFNECYTYVYNKSLANVSNASQEEFQSRCGLSYLHNTKVYQCIHNSAQRKTI
jgi:hypothetical protein